MNESIPPRLTADEAQTELGAELLAKCRAILRDNRLDLNDVKSLRRWLRDNCTIGFPAVEYLAGLMERIVADKVVDGDERRALLEAIRDIQPEDPAGSGHNPSMLANLESRRIEGSESHVRKFIIRFCCNAFGLDPPDPDGNNAVRQCLLIASCTSAGLLSILLGVCGSALGVPSSIAIFILIIAAPVIATKIYFMSEYKKFVVQVINKVESNSEDSGASYILITDKGRFHVTSRHLFSRLVIGGRYRCWGYKVWGWTNDFTLVGPFTLLASKTDNDVR